MSPKNVSPSELFISMYEAVKGSSEGENGVCGRRQYDSVGALFLSFDASVYGAP